MTIEFAFERASGFLSSLARLEFGKVRPYRPTAFYGYYVIRGSTLSCALESG
jgi:hypothetical protein